MGGKSTNSQQQVTIPPQVLAQYQAVNARATQAASTPFKQYSGQFVAPINPQQSAGIAGTNAGANEAQPAFAAATGDINQAQARVNPVNAAAESGTTASGAPIGADQINRYLSPYLNTVLGSTESLINQQNQQAQTGALGTAIQSGAFGGDRTGLAAANLNQQQELAAGNIYSGIANTGYQSALGTAMGEQQIGLSAAQQLAGIGQTAYGEGANTASTVAGLGAGAQTARLQGAQAQLGAGTLQQQTQQARDTALYNQFLQQQSYPFQVDQFLANIAEGTGALSGSTTGTTQPGGFFSDERLKHDIKGIGKLYDGQKIYSYKMHGDPRTHIGLIAQKVEKKHPEAVGLAAGYKTVDYGKATEKAANRDHFWEGGIAGRKAYAYGGEGYAPIDYSGLVQSHAAMYGEPGGGPGSYGLAAGAIPRGGSTRVPAPMGGGHNLVTASGGLNRQPTGMENVTALTNLTKEGTMAYNQIQRARSRTSAPAQNPPVTAPAAPTASVAGVAQSPTFSTQPDGSLALADTAAATDAASAAAPAAMDASNVDLAMGAGAKRGGVAGYASGGGPYSDVAGAGSTQLGIPLATQGHSAFFSRGGIAGRHGYDYGGMPYDTGASLDIPNDPSNRALATAPALSGGSGGGGGSGGIGGTGITWGQVAGLAGDAAMIAAFAKRGGRIGYQDGGSPTDDQLPESTVVFPHTHDTISDAPVAGVSPGKIDAPPIDAGPTPTAGIAPPPPEAAPPSAEEPKKGGSWWDEVKKPENLVPLLTAIGAMGTAPTKHLGVALAAGLGAGAQSYYPAHEAAAETQGMNIQNQRAQWILDQMRNAPPGPGVNQTTPQMQTLAGTGMNPLSVSKRLQSIGMIPDTWTSDEQAALAYQASPQRAYSGRPDMTNNVKLQHAARITGAQSMGQQSTNRIYEASYQAASDTSGGALDKVRTIDPVAAQQISDIATSKEDAENLARSYAWQVGGMSHRYANRGAPVVGADGVPRDKETQQILVGGTPQGVSQEQQAQNLQRLYGTVDTGAKARPTLGGMMPAGSRGSAVGSQPTLGQGAPPTVAPAPGGGPRPLQAPTTTGVPTTPTAPARPARQQALIDELHNPNTATAFAAGPSPTTRPAATSPGRGTIPTAVPDAPQVPRVDVSTAPNKPWYIDDVNRPHSDAQDADSKDIWPKFKTEVQKTADSLADIQTQQVDAQRVLNLLPNAKLGPGTAEFSRAQAFFETMTGAQLQNLFNNNASAHAMIEKSLANTALLTRLQEQREAGAQVRLGSSESYLIVNKLSASPEMPANAVKSLVNWHLQELNYEAQKSDAAQQFLDQGKNVEEFDHWYAKANPYPKAVSLEAPEGTTTHKGAKATQLETRPYKGKMWTYDPSLGPRNDPNSWKSQ